MLLVENRRTRSFKGPVRANYEFYRFKISHLEIVPIDAFLQFVQQGTCCAFTHVKFELRERVYLYYVFSFQ